MTACPKTPTEFHPACLCLPRMAADEYQALRLSIRAGFDRRHPILLFEGMILDGRHRYLACQDEGIAPSFQEWSGSDPFEFVRREHEARRSWVSQEQKALVLSDLIQRSDAFQAERRKAEAEANRKRAEAARAQIAEQPRTDTGKVISRVSPQVEAGPGKNNKPQPVRDHATESQRKASTALAAQVGVNRAAVERADFIRKNSPTLAQKVIDGEVPASAAIREIRREQKKEELKEIAAQEAVAPTGLFDVIVIDPPWPMEKIERDVRPNQSAFDYPTMSEKELTDLAIPMDQHCHVWLWTTHRFLPMAFRLLEAWGLKYVCAFVWHKPGGFQPMGLPQYNCEFALYARKGTPSFLDTSAFPVCFNAPRGAHSEKPDEFYDVVRRVTGGRRLDMFNRRLIPGFSGWGKEAAA